VRFSATRKSKRKKPPFHQEQAASPRRFCSDQKLLTCASVENPVLDQATVHLLAGWQIAAFAKRQYCACLWFGALKNSTVLPTETTQVRLQR
jgi:hypothetical protein